MGKDKQTKLTLEVQKNKENLTLGGSRPALRQIGNNLKQQSVYNDRSVLIPKSKRGGSSPSKIPIKMYKSTEMSSSATQTELNCKETGCGTTDSASEAMISALTGGPLNETYFESLAEQRREALSITLEENEELYKEIEKLEISLSEMTKRAEDAEYQVLRSKLHEEEEILERSLEAEKEEAAQGSGEGKEEAILDVSHMLED